MLGSPGKKQIPFLTAKQSPFFIRVRRCISSEENDLHYEANGLSLVTVNIVV